MRNRHKMSIAGLIALVSRVETALALLYLSTLAALWEGNWTTFSAAFLLTPPLIWLSVSDLERHELPDLGTLMVACISMVYVVASGEGILPHLITGLAVCGLLWGVGEVYFRTAGIEGLGIGDAKLFGAGGLLLGWEQLPEFFLFASIGGIAAALLRRLRMGADEGIPFGPFIAYSMFILLFLDPLFL